MIRYNDISLYTLYYYEEMYYLNDFTKYVNNFKRLSFRLIDTVDTIDDFVEKCFVKSEFNLRNNILGNEIFYTDEKRQIVTKIISENLNDLRIRRFCERIGVIEVLV